MSLRLLAVVAEFVLAGGVGDWGVATTLRPEWWTAGGARWWVGWTREPVARVHGAAVAVVGIGLLVGAVAAAATPPGVAIPALVRDLQLAGLAVVVLGGALLAATHPDRTTPRPTARGPRRRARRGRGGGRGPAARRGALISGA